MSCIAIPPLLYFCVGMGLRGNFNFTQHITRDSGGGDDTVLFTIITFLQQNFTIMLCGGKDFTHMVLEDKKMVL